MNPGSVDPLPGVSLGDLVEEAKKQLKQQQDGSEI
jgi:hypothetical protein